MARTKKTDPMLQRVIYAHIAGYSSAEIAKALNLPLLKVDAWIAEAHKAHSKVKGWITT